MLTVSLHQRPPADRLQQRIGQVQTASHHWNEPSGIGGTTTSNTVAMLRAADIIDGSLQRIQGGSRFVRILLGSITSVSASSKFCRSLQ
jgi:hypothetical protein